MLLFLHSLSFFLSLLCWLLPFSFLCTCFHLQRLWSKIISIENPPSTDSMVQSTSSLTLPSLVGSLLDVLHVSCQSSFFTSTLPLSLRIYMHRAGKRALYPFHVIKSTYTSAESIEVEHLGDGQ